MGGIGIVLNPRAGRDIRRLVARAGMVSGPDKMLQLRRVIAGTQALGAVPVYLVADEEGLAQRVGADEPAVTVLPGGGRLAGPDATALAVHRLEDAGVDAVAVIGGDGTQRQVAKAHPQVPVLPLAGGTNNVACWLGEDTVAGLALAHVVRDGPPAVPCGKVLVVETDSGQNDLAVVDVAWVAAPFVGALAVWDGGLVSRLVLGVADPLRPGLSNVGGHVNPVAAADDAVLELVLGPRGQVVPAVLAPGLLVDLAVASHRRHPLDQDISGTLAEPFTVALDGERTLTLRPHEHVRVTARRTGPRWLDPAVVLNRRGGVAYRAASSHL